MPDSGIVQVDTSTVSGLSGPFFGPLRQVLSHVIGVGNQSEFEIGQWLGNHLAALGHSPEAGPVVTGRLAYDTLVRWRA